MRAGGTLAVSSIWTNLIDCCKPILARRRNRRGPTALQGVSTWIHGDAAVCYFLRSQNSMPRSTRKYTHCCRTAPIPQQGTSSQVGARCCVDGVPTHRRQDAVPALCPKVDAFTPDSGVRDWISSYCRNTIVRGCQSLGLSVSSIPPA